MIWGTGLLRLYFSLSNRCDPYVEGGISPRTGLNEPPNGLWSNTILGIDTFN